MDTFLNRVADVLFAPAAHRAVNVKFFRGDCSTVTAEQLAQQLDSANSQVNDGSATRVSNLDDYQPAA